MSKVLNFQKGYVVDINFLEICNSNTPDGYVDPQLRLCSPKGQMPPVSTLGDCPVDPLTLHAS